MRYEIMCLQNFQASTSIPWSQVKVILGSSAPGSSAVVEHGAMPAVIFSAESGGFLIYVSPRNWNAPQVRNDRYVLGKILATVR